MPPTDDLRVIGQFLLADGDLTGDHPRTWIQVMIVGQFKHPKSGEFAITEDDLDAYAADIEERADQILIDFDHDSAYGNTKAAGWYTGRTEIKPDEQGRTALFAEIELTPSGAEAVRSKEYRYISPEFSKTYRDETGKLIRKVRMWATALTNRPFLPDMAAVALSDVGVHELARGDVVWAPEAGLETLRQKVNAALNPGPMDSARYWVMDVTSGRALVQEYQQSRTWIVPFTVSQDGVDVAPASDWVEAMQEWVEAAVTAGRLNAARRPFPTNPEGDTTMNAETLKLLGLSENATDDEIAEAVKAQAEKAAKTDDLETKLNAVPDVDDDAVKKFLASDNPGDALRALITSAARGEEAAKELHTMRRDSILEKATETGKVLPAQLDAYRAMYDADPENVAALLEATPEKSFAEVGSGHDKDNEPDVTKARAEYTSEISGTHYTPDDASLKLDQAARKILTDRGKNEFTNEEYLSALEEASNATAAS